jgi:hypothetical protein
MAVFVEGHTEAAFLDKLIHTIAGHNKVRIAWHKIRGGVTRPQTMRQIRAAGPDEGQEHYILLCDCGNDRAVKTRMLHEYDNLVRAGYQRIVCVRDVYPEHTHADIGRLEAGLAVGVKTKPVAVDFILSVMEVEAYFLAEHSHLARIDPRITPENVRLVLGFDPAKDDMRLRPHPAEDLDHCYRIGEKTYDKETGLATLDALDYAVVYLELVEKFPYLRRLCQIVSEFLRG